MFSYTKILKNSKYCKHQAILILRLSFSLLLTENNFTIKGKINRFLQDYSTFEQYYKSSVTVAVEEDEEKEEEEEEEEEFQAL